MKRTLSLILALALIVFCIPFAASADEELRINFMKADAVNPGEGTTTIYSYAGWGEELTKPGFTFEWSAVAVFDYDESTGGYRVTATYERQPAKSDVKIPEKGFAIAYNMGNNWPALFENATGNEWYYYASNTDGTPYSQCPNFVSDYNEANGAVIAGLQIGDIFYLVGCDLAHATVRDNGKNYWEEGYESGTYITSVKPTGDTPDDQYTEHVEQTMINISHADPEALCEGATTMFTRKGWGEELTRDGMGFEWTAIAIFDYDETTGGFKVTEKYELAPTKTNVKIPEKGFALTYNQGNNWPALFAGANGSEWYYNASNSAGVPYSECPNFINAKNEANGVIIQSLSIGDIFYLVGCNLNKAAVSDNGANYWEEDYETYTYLTDVKPDELEDPFAEIEDSAVLGDFDGDGNVTSDDAVYLLRNTLFPNQYPVSGFADFDNDGSITSDDAVYLLRYTLFPAQYPIVDYSK